MEVVDVLLRHILELLLITAGAVILAVLLILKTRVTGWFREHFVVDVVKTNSRILELLVEIRVKTAADRVSVFLFHNGEHYVNGNSILRLSGAYESLAAGISSNRDSSQNILVSTVPEAVDFLLENNPRESVFFHRTDQLPQCYYKAVLESQGIQAVAKYPLCQGSDIIGFVCVDFVQSPSCSAGELKVIQYSAPQIELYLNTRKSRLHGLLRRIPGGV